MKNIIVIFCVVAAGCLAIAAFDSKEMATVATPSVELFTPLTGVDSITPHYFTWRHNALKKGTVYWLIDVSKAAADSAKTMLITVEQSMQTAPLGGVTQRWYTTDTIATLVGTVASPQRHYKDTYSHALAGREVRLKIVSTDNHSLTTGKVDFAFKPDF